MESQVSLRHAGEARSPACRHRRPCPPAECRPASAAGKRRRPRGHGLGPVSTERRSDCPGRRPWRGSLYSIRLDCARSPPRLGGFFGRPRAMLVSSNDGTIDYGVFVVGIRRQRLEHPLPNASLCPATMTRVHLLPLPKSLRQIPPRDARSVSEQHRLEEQSIVFRRHPDMPLTARKQVFNPFPLVVTQAIAAHGSAPRIS